MTYADTMTALNAKRAEIETIQAEMRAIQAKGEPEVVQDYVLDGWDGPVRLSELFGGKRDLILIHNMGAGCPACTMWADGFNGVYDHLAALAAFVLASPNPVEVQKRFAESRGWRFPIVSYGASHFAEDMGYRHRDPDDERTGGWNPGVSIFRREGDSILRLTDAEFGDYDAFCALWAFYSLIPDPDPNWKPSYSYA